MVPTSTVAISPNAARLRNAAPAPRWSHEPGQGRAEGRAAADREPDQPERCRIMTSTPRDIGNNQREQHTEDRRPEPVKELYRDDQIRIADLGEQNAANR